MKKIIITIPKDRKNSWILNYFGGTRKRSALGILYAFVERRLGRSLASLLKDKTAVYVKDGQVVVNESYASRNPRYLLYCLACFLEDFLKDNLLLEKYKKYRNYDMKGGE